jgi:hypothetical protein
MTLAWKYDFEIYTDHQFENQNFYINRDTLNKNRKVQYLNGQPMTKFKLLRFTQTINEEFKPKDLYKPQMGND